MGNMNALDWISFFLVVIGGINWGLVGALDFNLVALLPAMVAKIVYILVGLAAIYALLMIKKHKGDSVSAPVSDAPVAAA